MKRQLLYILLFLPLFSCEIGDSEPVIDEETGEISDGQFTINLIEGYPYGAEEIWLIIHDLEGNPIKYTTVAKGSSTQFDIDRNSRYHITIFTKNSAYGYNITLLKTYTNVKVTSDFTLGLNTQSGANLTTAGIFDIKIDTDETGYSAYSSTSFNSYQVSTNYLEKNIQLTTPLYLNEPTYLVVARNNLGENRYTYLSSPSKDTTYSFDFNTLKAFDKVIPLRNTEQYDVYFAVNALKEKDGDFRSSYLVSSNNFGGPSTEIAYLNEFETYATEVDAYSVNGAMANKSFYKIGEVPNQIEFLTYNQIPVQDATLTDFSTSMFPEATDYSVTFDYPNLYTYPESPITVRWIVTGNQPTFKLDLPVEMKNLYSTLSDLSKMQLESINMNKSSISYDQYIIDELVKKPKLKKIEISSIQQFFPKN